jgi:hypothetical protein
LAAAKGDGDKFSPTIGCKPYEEHSCGPAPVTDLAEDDQDIESCRERCGHRPLTVLTDALNLFFDPLPEMNAILETQGSNGRGTRKDQHMSRNLSTGTARLAPSLNTSVTACSSRHNVRATTSSSSDTHIIVHGDAATLFNSPPPLLSDHPINRGGEDPFKVRTDYPLMTTNTTVPDIKALAKETMQLSSKSAGFAEDLRKKRSFKNLGGLLTKSAPPTQMAFGSELSPAVAAKHVSLARASDESSPTTPSLTPSTCGSFEARSKRMRKISTLFNKTTKDSDSATRPPKTNQIPRSRKTVTNLPKPVENKSGHASMDVASLRRGQPPTSNSRKSIDSEHQLLVSDTEAEK